LLATLPPAYGKNLTFSLKVALETTDIILEENH
jgi:hypothetical protein